ncbi:MAG TPA: NUDIX domain-containing protein [Thermoanaerobaculia bacterium]|nr:NUDIX domain-containing protein [Thermoanaerobaculia bacterium]
MTRAATLLALIEAYEPADAMESRHRDRFLELLRLSGDPLRRDHFDPGHITASAFVIHRKSRRLLLHRHRRLGRWLQMGGHIEPVESTAVAALREAREESGLADLALITETIFDLDLHLIPSGKGEPDHLHFDVRYLLETRTPEAIAIQVAESEDLRWFPLDDAIGAMNEACSTRAIRKIERLIPEAR